MAHRHRHLPTPTAHCPATISSSRPLPGALPAVRAPPLEPVPHEHDLEDGRPNEDDGLDEAPDDHVVVAVLVDGGVHGLAMALLLLLLLHLAQAALEALDACLEVRDLLTALFFSLRLVGPTLRIYDAHLGFCPSPFLPLLSRY